MGSSLTVNIAKFDRKVSSKQKMESKHNQNYVQRTIGQAFRDGRTVAEVMTGKIKNSPPPPRLSKKSVALADGTIMAEWLHNPLTLVGEVHSLEKLRNVPLDIRMGSKNTYGMKYLGGLMVGMHFQFPSDVEDFLSKKQYWGEWF